MEPPPRPSSSSLFQVYLRLKPPTAPSLSTTQASIFYPNLHPTERYLTVEEATGGDVANPTHITVVPPKDSRKRAIEKFAFTKVFQEDAAQLDIFKGTGIIPLIEGVLGANARNGRDGLFATLGVTGSGKSHTMLGSSSQRGLTQLSLDVLFRSLGGSLLDPIASASTPQSLANSDASEAQLLPAPVFLDGVYGEVRPDWGNSRAPTPMLVGTELSSPPHPSSQALYPSLLGINVGNSPPAKAHFFHSPIFRNPFSRKKDPTKPRIGNSKDAASMPPTPSHGRHHRPQRPSALPHLPDVNDVRVTIDDGMEYAVIISMYEVYNDRIFDLLSSSSHSGQPNSRADKDLRRRPLLFKSTEHSPDRKVVAGLRKIICGSLAEALMVLEAGLLERRVAGTGSNSVSSRSHGFFCVEVKRRRKASSSPWSGSTLTVVDLAGSERARNAKTAGATLAEAGKINESLMYLGQCLQMQSDNSDGHKSSLVPFRQCKLTELLFSNSFPSASSTSHHHTSTHHAPQKAIMIVTADPLGDFNATSQILRYSALAREITVPRVPSLPSSVLSGMHARSDSATSGRTTPNSPPSAELEYAAQEIARLSEELDVMTFRLADEEKRRIDAESAWQAADERCLQIEQEVREECSAEMEKRMEVEMRRWKGAWGEEADRNDEHMDKKLGILTQSIYIHEDVEPSSSQRTRELEDENDALRRRVNQLEHELQGRSPTRRSKFSSLASTPRQSIMDTSTNDVENTRPMMGEKLLFPTSPSKSPRRSTRKPLQDTTTTTSPFVQADEPSYIESDASLLSQQTDQSHDGESGSENWAVIGSGRSTMSAFGQTMAGLDALSLGDTSGNWTTTMKTIRTPTKTPRKNAMTLLSSSPVVMDETTLRETGSAVKKAAKTPGTGRKVRKLTTRKWDLADEEELSS